MQMQYSINIFVKTMLGRHGEFGRKIPMTVNFVKREREREAK